MNIHFICYGNTYRSRLAESYLNSLKLKKVKTIPSGILAKKQSMQLRWYAEKNLEEKGLSEFASKNPNRPAKKIAV